MSHDSSYRPMSAVERRSAEHQVFLAKMGVRTSQGSFYTPLDVAEHLISTALADALSDMREPEDCPFVLDPTCGTGNFLIVAALQLSERIGQLGLSDHDALEFVIDNRIFGTDLDDRAVYICRQNLASLAPDSNCATRLSSHILQIDSLRLFLLGGGRAGQGSLFDEPEPTWADVFPEAFVGDDPGFDAVVGNPPFLNQLETETAISTELATALIDRYGATLSKLTNTASIFMLGASEIVNSTGVISLIQPVSFLATRESAEVRRRLLQRGSLKELWFGGSGIFDAAVEIVGVTVTLKQSDNSTRISLGRAFESAGSVPSPTVEEGTWSRVLARARGVPHCEFASSGLLREHANATADFRDQYYGLVGVVRELGVGESCAGLLRLATVGLIDLAHFMWGERSTKFAKEKFDNPVVDPKQLSDALRDWAESRSRPKVIVSNQTKNLEVFVDTDGDILPSVPLLTVDCEAHKLWLVAAAIASPVASLVAAERHLGAGMSVDVLKLSAKDVLSLPVPIDLDAWARGARAFEQLQACESSEERSDMFFEFASIMNSAYEVQNPMIADWWLGRLPRR